jgi:hypothetical protein
VAVLASIFDNRARPVLDVGGALTLDGGDEIMDDDKTGATPGRWERLGSRGRRTALAGALAVAVSVGAVGVASAASTHHAVKASGSTTAARTVTVATTKKAPTHTCPNAGSGTTNSNSSFSAA